MYMVWLLNYLVRDYCIEHLDKNKQQTIDPKRAN